MLDVIFLVEDKNDVIFLRDLILKNYCESDTDKAKKIKEKICEISINDKKILIRDTDEIEGKTGSWSKIKGLINSNFFGKEINENEEVKFVAIFDSDEDKTENKEQKQLQFDKWLMGKDFTIDRFYLPFNNSDSHNLEQLLEMSFSKSFNECWTPFVECIKEKDNEAIEPQSKKGKIILYKDFYSIKPNEGYLSDKWNLDFNTNINLQPLKSFLDTYLQ